MMKDGVKIMTNLSQEVLEEVRYTVEEHCGAHFADMIDSGQGIGSSDISICANEVIDFFATGYGINEVNYDIPRGLVVDMIHETLVEMENEYA